MWKLYVDGSTTSTVLGAGIILITPTGYKFHTALRFKFEASNNEAEYEALLASLRMAVELKAGAIHCYNDSLLVVNHILGEYQARGSRMVAYLRKVQNTLDHFEYYKVEQIPREENDMVDALARLATSRDADELSIIPVKVLGQPSISESEDVVLLDEQVPWMTPILQYLRDGILLIDRNSARRLMYQIPRYLVDDKKLYRRGFSTPLLYCVAEPECTAILMEVHEGFCRGHTGAHNLAQKIIRQGYFWPTLKHDAIEYVKKCDKCQRFFNVPRAPPIELTAMSSPWPFAVWGIDLIGLFPVGKGDVKHAIVVVDYFTKWTEAEPLASITTKKYLDFVIKNIVC